ncbi:exonuclease domain-containing protein [Boudabousia marimammalium]|uniref:DNA polymerase III subunit epsilon n=1 Tax=Boudabousia marimammalium TaxID=156892 RepID=A0A1Q5PM44_9ACTO|nr:exonuclease domain-containing protein [Boudabousia marimammalium]OKL48116.1 DNA polymerase III subunit epsilon [Boudabousia marimammalium]
MSIAMNKIWTNQFRFGFDTETTGVNPTQVRLVTAALVLRQPKGEDQVITWLANPGVPIPEAASRVHGISTERAVAEGRPITEVLEEVASQIVDYWQRGGIMVAFNAGYDLQVLNSELKRHGMATLEERCGASEVPAGGVVDPLVLDRAVDRYRKGKRTLGAMCETYQVEPGDNLHTAEYDVIATLNVLDKIVENYPKLAQLTVAEIVSFQREAHHAWAENFNEFLSRRGRPADVGTRWPY